MRLTPIDIQQQQFGRSLRGYDAKEVENFLDLVATQVGATQPVSSEALQPFEAGAVERRALPELERFVVC